jgi:hypothetical protein
MKKNASPEFDAKWWKANQPKGLTKAKGLEDALSDFQDAKEKLKKSETEDDFQKCVVAIGKVRQAAEAVMSEADKLKKSPPKGADAEDLGNTSDAIKKYARMYDTEKTNLERLVKEDEDDDNVFKDASGYKKYLLKMLRKAGNAVLPDRPSDAPDNWEPTGGLNFAVVLGKKAGDHRMAISKTKGGGGLDRQLKEATGLHVSTFGVLFQDKEASEAVVLSLTGKQLPGLGKKIDRMLKAFKPLPYTHAVLMVGGKEVEDLADPDDTETDEEEHEEQVEQHAPDPALGQVRATFEKIFPVLQNLLKAGGPLAAQLAGLARQYQAGMAASDAVAAKKAVDEIIAMMRTASTQRQQAPTGTTQGTKAPVNYDQLLDNWLKARGDAETGVQKLRGAILEEFKNEQELPAIQRNITKLDAIMTTIGTALQERLTAARSGAEAQKADLNKAALDEARRAISYITSDQLIAAVQDNPFTPVDLRGTLGGPLQQIETALAA